MDVKYENYINRIKESVAEKNDYKESTSAVRRYTCKHVHE